MRVACRGYKYTVTRDMVVQITQAKAEKGAHHAMAVVERDATDEARKAAHRKGVALICGGNFVEEYLDMLRMQD